MMNRLPTHEVLMAEILYESHGLPSPKERPGGLVVPIADGLGAWFAFRFSTSGPWNSQLASTAAY